MSPLHHAVRVILLLGLALLLAVGAGIANVPAYKLARPLLNPVATEGDSFGYSVAMVGGNLLVGAPFADLGGTDAGAAYLFDGKTGDLLRTFQKPTPAAGDWFGISVAAVGENVLVGALGDDTGAHDAGAAYLFDGKTGELLRTYQNPTPAEDDWFGGAVAGVGENVLVGAPLDDAGAKDAGAAYLFDGKTGSLLRMFLNPTPASNDWFGVSLAGVGDRVLVGAFLDDTGAKDAGAAYLFDSKKGALLQTLQKPKPAAGDQFGVSVAALGDRLLIGAPYDDTGAKDAGAVYVFDAATGALARTLQAPTPAAGELFGRAVAAAGDRVLIGAPREAGGKAGAAYLLDAATGALIQQFRNPSPADGDQFGFSLAATPDTLLIASPGDHAGTNAGGGALLYQP
jgi:outer membrane protein assembly factor BamB